MNDTSANQLSEPKCPACGGVITADAPLGLCPKCLMREAFENDESPNSAGPTPTAGAPLGGFGNYDLLEELGHGGMGVVYKARQRSLQRVVALKMLLGGQFAGKVALGRFRAEAELAAQLQHPNIVAIHEIGEQDGLPYFTMDFVAGRNLVNLVRDHPLSAQAAANYVQIIARAIHYAHEQGVLHRDLKPSNILIDAFDQPRITDFGLAKRLTGSTSDLTVSGQALGSPNFMPPEQAAGKHKTSGPTSDIYGLGAILYYLITGRPPFMAENASAAVRQVLENEPVSPRVLNPGVPRDLETLCLKCLQKEPTQRYASAQAVADELGRFLRGEPILARPVSTVTHVWRWCRRKPQVAGLSLALVVLGVTGFAAVLQQWQRAEKMMIEEARQRARADGTAQHARRLLYTSDVNLAQQALKMNNLDRARRLLDRHRPQAGEEDLRGWEWRYLWQKTRSSALIILTNRQVHAWSVSLSHEGSRLAVGWYDGRVDLWDVPGRRLIRALREHENEPRACVAFSPVRNLLAYSSEVNRVTLYDLDAGRESVFWEAPDQLQWRVLDMAFSQDGSKLVIYTMRHDQNATLDGATLDDAVLVVNVSSAHVENCQATTHTTTGYTAARLSPDNRRLYLARAEGVRHQYTIICVDLATNKALWQTEPQRDYGLTALAISPDGRVLASGSGFAHSEIRIWNAETGRLLNQLAGHSSWVSALVFSRDGRQLISTADQTIRFWDTSTWLETKVLRGHIGEVHDVAISEPARLVASAGKEGNLILWQEDGKGATDGYRLLPGNLRAKDVLVADHARVLTLPSGQPPELLDLAGDKPPMPLPDLGSSTNVLGWSAPNILCHWDGTNQLVVRELRGSEFIHQGAVALDSGRRPLGAAFHAARQLLAWTDVSPSASVHLTTLSSASPRTELKCDVPGFVPIRFSEDGRYLVALREPVDDIEFHSKGLCAWETAAGQRVASVDGDVQDFAFAAGGRVLVVAIHQTVRHEIEFHDLFNPRQPPRRVSDKGRLCRLSVSPDGSLVAASSQHYFVRLFDPLKGELVVSLDGFAHSVAFPAEGRRLISAAGGSRPVTLWNLGTQEALLVLPGAGSFLRAVRSSADGKVILAGPPWQAWSAPSWEEIAAAEAKEKTQFRQP